MARKRFDGERLRGWVAAAGIIGAAAAVYLLLPLTSQAHTDGDESVAGVMAKHIRGGRHYPLMFYGQPYGGGAVIEAWLAVLPFRLFGVFSVSLKLSAVTGDSSSRFSWPSAR
jgi:hypothetical protein